MELKKPLCALLALLLLTAVLSGCGEKAASGPDLDALLEAMTDAAPALPEMLTVSSESEGAEDLFAYLSDVDYDKVSGFFLTYSAEGLADEIAVVRMKDAADTGEMKESLEEHAEDRVKLFRSYDPDQVARAEDALIFTSGSDVVLIICDDPDAVREAYRSVES